MSSIEQWLNTYGSDTETELDTTFNELSSVEKWMIEQEKELIKKQQEEALLKEQNLLKEQERLEDEIKNAKLNFQISITIEKVFRITPLFLPSEI